MNPMLNLGPLATTSIGSFPRPQWLAKTNVTRIAFVVPPENMQEACDDATILVLRHQEKLGLDLVTDGEQRRTGGGDDRSDNRRGVKPHLRRRWPCETINSWASRSNSSAFRA